MDVMYGSLQIGTEQSKIENRVQPLKIQSLQPALSERSHGRRVVALFARLGEGAFTDHALSVNRMGALTLALN
jgi:hypothetical protein